MDTNRINFQNATFITSAPDISKMPDDLGIEVAFVGRSNAGKSSALNTLTNQRKLAHTSKTPGRTQLINVFEIEAGKRLIDLPGYGFAKVPEEVKRKWQRALSEYLEKRESLQGIVVLMDVRHPFKELDNQLLQWAVESDLPVLALLTKADKLKQQAKQKALREGRELAAQFDGDIQVELFSSLKGTGKDKMVNKLTEWYNAE